MPARRQIRTRSRQRSAQRLWMSCGISANSASMCRGMASSANRWHSASIMAPGGAIPGQRLAGIEPGEQTLYEMAPQRSQPGHIVLTSFGDRRDRTRFAAAYNDPASGITTGPRPPAPVCVGPLSYAGHDMVRHDIANFKSALAASGVEEGFMTAVAPGSC